MKKILGLSGIPGGYIPKFSKILERCVTKSIWGMDIGGSALKAVKVKKTKNEVMIEEVDIIEYPSLPANERGGHIPYIKGAVSTFLSKQHISKKDKIVVSIPGQLVLSRFLAVPSVSRKRLRDIVSYEVKNQIPFDPKDIVWDYQQLSEYTPGADIEIGLFASKRATLDHILTDISPLIPNLTALQVTPLALYNFVEFDCQVKGAAIIINVEEENTDIIITNGKHVWLRSIMNPGVNTDLVREIKRSVEYYKSLVKADVHFKTLLLVNERFKDPAHRSCIVDSFSYEVRILQTLNNLKISERIDLQSFNKNLLGLGVALGLALQGIGLGRLNTNLLPAEITMASEMSKKKSYAIAAAGCLSLLLIIRYAGLKNQLLQLSSSINYYERELQNIKNLEQKYKTVEKLAQSKKSSLDLISSIDHNRYFWMEILDRIVSIIPDKVLLTGIHSIWVDEDSVVSKSTPANIPPSGHAKKRGNSSKKTASKKLLLMKLQGESKEPSITYIEQHVLKPIQEITLSGQKVAAFKGVHIAPHTCRQVVDEEGNNFISFEIRWIVKSQEEVDAEMQSLLLSLGTSTSSAKS